MTNAKYSVVEFLSSPSNVKEQYVCVPDIWIKWREPYSARVGVLYPDGDNMAAMLAAVRQEQCSKRTLYFATLKHSTDTYDKGVCYIEYLTQNSLSTKSVASRRFTPLRPNEPPRQRISAMPNLIAISTAPVLPNSLTKPKKPTTLRKSMTTPRRPAASSTVTSKRKCKPNATAPTAPALQRNSLPNKFDKNSPPNENDFKKHKNKTGETERKRLTMQRLQDDNASVKINRLLQAHMMYSKDAKNKAQHQNIMSTSRGRPTLVRKAKQSEPDLQQPTAESYFLTQLNALNNKFHEIAPEIRRTWEELITLKNYFEAWNRFEKVAGTFERSTTIGYSDAP
ncbi:hypothetical protein O0L34_g11505 [Tuta absoluta]|nr:hypothetical protein O0L34_g11505 [Tuta absoluta]